MSDTRKLGVVFASAEAAPFVKTGGLGDVAGSLPSALVAEGVDVIVMVPKYSTIADEFKGQMEHVGEFYVPLGWRNEYCGLERLERSGVTYLFLDNEHYFDRSYPYGFFDDGERFAFFSKAICESLQHLPGDFTCHILHCNDWHTALAPVFLREFYNGIPLYDNVRTIFSIHNIAFQGQYSDEIMNDILGLAHIPAAANQLRCDASSINYMMGALNYSDAITTVSPTYAEEIKTPAFGEHLDGVLNRRAEALQGIVNGIDTEHFNPATDPAIAASFTVDDLSGKAACKAALQQELGLTVRTDQPLMTMVTRLTRQKGMDLVTYALDRILSGGVQVAVLGTGDNEYENALRYFESKYPGQMAARIQFDPALSQRMYAGSDLFLMPSLFEPCGLSQMIAMRYGTLPVVRETGGLKDTVIPYNYETGEGTGFSFANFNGDEMGDAVFRGARLFWDDHAAFERVVKQAMTTDFSWKRSADKYMDLYFWMHPEIARPLGAEPVVVDEQPAAQEPVVEAEAAPVEAPAEEPVVEKAEVEAEPAAEETEPEPTPAEEKPAETKPAKKTATKKPAAKKATTKAAETEDAPVEKPKEKKAPTKKPAAKKTAKTKAEEAPVSSAPAVTKPKTEEVAEKPAKKAPAKKTAATKKPSTKKAEQPEAKPAKKTSVKAATAPEPEHEPKHMKPEMSAEDALIDAIKSSTKMPAAKSVSAAKKPSTRKRK